MLNWIGIDQLMKMRETSRGEDKKLHDNNKLLGKSFITAIFVCCRAILYPGSKIIVASGNKDQAGLIITEKIEDLRRNYPALAKEIKKIQNNKDNVKCIFKNGSVITAIASNDGARGLRGNVLVADEFRLIKLDIINSVLKQFLTNPRKPPFLEKPEYKDYPLESNMEIKRYVSI